MSKPKCDRRWTEAIGYAPRGGPRAPLPVPGRPIHYRVLMEPIGTNVFFLAERPQSLSGNFRQVSMDARGGVRRLDAERPINRYEAESQLPAIDSDELRLAMNTAPGGMNDYLKPGPPLDIRISKLAEEIAAPAPSTSHK